MWNRNNNPTKWSECYQSNIVSMTSGKSPITWRLTNAGRPNSFTGQRSWRHFLIFQIIHPWQVGEIEFQCRLAPFVISRWLELRVACGESKRSLNSNTMNAREKAVRYQQRRSAWYGVQGGQGECWWRWRSAECNWGAQIQAKEHLRGLKSAYPAV